MRSYGHFAGDVAALRPLPRSRAAALDAWALWAAEHLAAVFARERGGLGEAAAGGSCAWDGTHKQPPWSGCILFGCLVFGSMYSSPQFLEGGGGGGGRS